MLLELMNTKQLPQDHPCVIDIIRRQFLFDPSPRNVPYNMSKSTDPNGDPSQEQTPIILNLVKNKVLSYF